MCDSFKGSQPNFSEFGSGILQVETARKILSLNMAERSVEQTSNATAQALLLDFVGSSQTLRLWSINRNMMENLHGSRVQEHMQKGKVIDEWWKQVMKGATWFYHFTSFLFQLFEMSQVELCFM